METKITTPTVSVLLPVYNGQRYIAEAIDSLLSQTFSDWECIILDDGSTDQTGSIVSSYTDPRIRYYPFDGNKGYVARLNFGVKKATGRYIARMDADDRNLPDRLYTQFQYLEQHPEVGICGTWIQLFDKKGMGPICQYPETDEGCRALLLVDVCFAHPTVMMRKDLFTAHSTWYDETLLPVEDYGFWIQASSFTRFANIPMVLYLYRQHGNQVSRRMAERQRKITNQLRPNQLQRLLPGVTKKDEQLFLLLASGSAGETPSELAAIKALAEQLCNAPGKNQFGDSALLPVVARSLFRSCNASGMLLHIHAWKTWNQFTFRKYYHPDTKEYLKFALYCFLGIIVGRWRK